MAKPPLSLIVLSDPICPWCWIGKRRLDAAMAQRPEAAVAVEWRPFMLNPDMAPEGMDRQAYLSAKFGGPARAAEVYGAIAEALAEAGLPARLDRVARTPSTVDAHRVLAWARAGGRDHALAEELFTAYFSNGLDIGDPEVLTACAARVGMDAGAVRAALARAAGRAEVRAEAVAAAEAGVTGAPTFIVGGSKIVPGAQPTAFWVAVLDQLAGAARRVEA